LESAFIGLFADVGVVLPEAKHAVDELCEVPRSSKDGDGSAFAARHAAEGRPESRLGSLQ
jgi:hypothetical protein